MQDMKLLLEGWRNFSSLVEQEKAFGNVFLFENKKAVKKDFSDLLHEHKIGKLSDDALYEAWHKSLIYEQQLLEKELNEVDWEKRAAEIEAGDVETDKYDAEGAPKPMMDRAMQKIRDFTIEKSVQLFQLVQKGITMAVKAASALIGAISRFKEKHPLVFKAVVILAVTAGMLALMFALEGNQAQAAIKAPASAPGGLTPGPKGEISDQAYEALRGLVHQTKNLGEGTDLRIRAEAMKLIDHAQAAKETIDIGKFGGEIGDFANEQLRTLNGLVKLAKEGDKDAAQWLDELLKTGKSAIYHVMNQPTRPIP